MKRYKLNKENTSKLENKPGVYTLHSCKTKKPVYVGISKVLKHRLSSYHQKDTLSAHPSKRRLRRAACSFSFRYTDLDKAKKVELRKKDKMKYNYV
jgi:excinuclease UvrABC nuclease subunit